MAFTSNHAGAEIYQFTFPSQNGFDHTFFSGDNIRSNHESNFWSNSPRSESPSPQEAAVASPIVGPYQIYTPVSYMSSIDNRGTQSYTRIGHSVSHSNGITHSQPPFVRVVKRRSTANKKERRRTLSINTAYADLRDCIPNVPVDTKLSKIKTLRLATSYISYLTGVLETDETCMQNIGAFRAELSPNSRKCSSHLTQLSEYGSNARMSPKSDASDEQHVANSGRRAKGRTGWPQHVWALELKQEQTH